MLTVMGKRVGSHVRYLAGNVLRWATAPWHESLVMVADATNIFGCSYADSGWHHIRRTLQEYDSNPLLDPAFSSLGKYLTCFCPQSISILANVVDEVPLPLFVYPWGTFSKRSIDTAKDPWTSRFCGPSTDQFVTEEYQRTIRLYLEMRQHGYRPTKYPNSFIQGAWLEAKDGRRRFVVLQGNHRLAVLAHMKSEPVTVRVTSQALGYVREADIEKWPLVASGRCSVDNARRIFNLFFSENGWHVARRIEADSPCIR
jgi:hypothetical protein